MLRQKFKRESAEKESMTFEAAVEPGSVTAIIPAYNGERFIRRSVDSILRQTFPVTQVIVVDDGSKDATREIIETEYRDRVTLLRQQNGGPARARNAGIRVATGEFIAFLDADDYWLPEKVSRQVRVLGKRPDAVGNYTGLRIVDDQDEFKMDVPPVDPATLWPKLRWCNPGVPPSSVMLRRSAVEVLEKGFDERLLGNEDWNLWFRLIRKGPFCVSPEPLTAYRSSPGGLSGNADHMYNDFRKMLDDTLLSDLSGLERAMWRRRILSYQEFKACLTARAAGDKVKEREYMKRSLLGWPSPFWAPERFRYFAVTLMRT